MYGKWHGFKLVGDNLDKNLRPRHQTSGRQTQSLHLFHYYAVHDRIDLSSAEDKAPIPPTYIEYKHFVPSEVQLIEIKKHFTTYAAR
jgi:L1 cell adhesion molecule like protein